MCEDGDYSFGGILGSGALSNDGLTHLVLNSSPQPSLIISLSLSVFILILYRHTIQQTPPPHPPDLLEGTTVLDLGCGAGRDVYIASQLVGATGNVIGIDMTSEQLDTAKEYQGYHVDKFGYDNVEFHLGLIENLDEIESLADDSVDIIISNCVSMYDM